jgi:integrase/recombinase XerD
MPAKSDIELRDRALVAITLATGARDRAIASMKLKHVDLSTGSVFQDAREVKTKNSKTFRTWFFPVGDEILAIVAGWVAHLRDERLWGDEDPLFPATRVEVNKERRFEAVGLARRHWDTAAPIRAIFGQAFEHAGLPYFNPHSFRNTLVGLGLTLGRSPEEFKAWSQNLGLEGVMTTFRSYGDVLVARQGEIIQSLAKEPLRPQNGNFELVEALVHRASSEGRPAIETCDAHRGTACNGLGWSDCEARSRGDDFATGAA